MWWCTPIIPELERLTQNDHCEFDANLSSIVKFCLKKNSWMLVYRFADVKEKQNAQVRYILSIVSKKSNRVLGLIFGGKRGKEKFFLNWWKDWTLWSCLHRLKKSLYFIHCQEVLSFVSTCSWSHFWVILSGSQVIKKYMHISYWCSDSKSTTCRIDPILKVRVAAYPSSNHTHTSSIKYKCLLSPQNQLGWWVGHQNITEPCKFHSVTFPVPRHSSKWLVWIDFTCGTRKTLALPPTFILKSTRIEVEGEGVGRGEW